MIKRVHLDQIEKDFMSGNAQLRRQVVENLVDCGDECVAFLVMALQDHDKGVRDAASFALSQLPSVFAAAQLVPLLGSDSIEIRNLASELLTKYGELSVDPLISALAAGDDDIRKFAIDILGLVGGTRQIDSLITALDDPEPNVAVSAAEALGNLAPLRAIDPLIDHYHRFEAMRPVVLEALGKFSSTTANDFLLKILQGDDLTLSLIALSSLAHSGDEGNAANLGKTLETLPAVLQEEAIKTIFSISRHRGADAGRFFDFDNFSRQIFGLLRNDLTEIADSVVQNLSESFIEAHLPEFILLTGHKNEELRFLVQERLHAIAIDTLISAMSTILPEIEVSGQLIMASLLAERDYEKSLPLLTLMSQASSPEVRAMAAQCLGVGCHPDAIKLLTQLVVDEDESVQVSAYTSLVNMQSDTTLAIFEEGFNHTTEYIRDLCAYAIAQISPERLAEKISGLLLADSRDELMFALKTAGQFPGLARLKDIAMLLTHEDIEVRASAARAMANFQHEEAYDEVKYLLNDPNRDVRLAAFEALVAISPERADVPITAALQDIDFWLQISGIDAAINLVRADVAPEIFRLVQSENKMVQTRSIQALLTLLGDDAIDEIRVLLEEKGDDADEILTTIRDELHAV